MWPHPGAVYLHFPQPEWDCDYKRSLTLIPAFKQQHRHSLRVLDAREHPSGGLISCAESACISPLIPMLTAVSSCRQFGFNICEAFSCQQFGISDSTVLQPYSTSSWNSIKIPCGEQERVGSPTDQTPTGLRGCVDAKSAGRLNAESAQYWYVLAIYAVQWYVTQPGCTPLFITAYVADSCLLKTYCHSLVLKGMQCPTPPAAPAGPLLVSFINSFPAKNSMMMS